VKEKGFSKCPEERRASYKEERVDPLLNFSVLLGHSIADTHMGISVLQPTSPCVKAGFSLFNLFKSTLLAGEGIYDVLVISHVILT